MELLKTLDVPAVKRNEDYDQSTELLELAHSELEIVSGGPEVENRPDN